MNLEVSGGRLAGFRATLLLVAWLAVSVAHPLAGAGSPAPAAGPGVTAAQLNDTIAAVLDRPEYAWRMSRDAAGLREGTSSLRLWLRDGFGWIERLYRWVRKWLNGLMPTPQDAGTGERDWQTSVQALLFALLAVTAAVLAVLVLRLWKRRQAGAPAPTGAVATAPITVLTDEVTADRLPPDEWLRLGRELLARGEWRLAMRALFLSGLAHLGRDGKVTIARHKSNREYAGELQRRAHDQPELLSAFRRSVGLLEGVWYGTHPATAEVAAAFLADLERIVNGGTPGLPAPAAAPATEGGAP